MSPRSPQRAWDAMFDDEDLGLDGAIADAEKDYYED